MTEKETSGVQKLTDEETELVSGGAIKPKRIPDDIYPDHTCPGCKKRFDSAGALRNHQLGCIGRP